MTTVTALIDAVAQAAHVNRSRVAQHAFKLRDHDILPRSSGRRIADVDTDHAVALLLAAVIDPELKDSAKVARSYAELPCRADVTVSLGEHLRRELDRSESGDHAVEEIVLLHEEPAATVRMTINGVNHDLRFGASDDWPSPVRRTLSHIYSEGFASLASSLD